MQLLEINLSMIRCMFWIKLKGGLLFFTALSMVSVSSDISACYASGDSAKIIPIKRKNAPPTLARIPDSQQKAKKEQNTITDYPFNKTFRGGSKVAILRDSAEALEVYNDRGEIIKTIKIKNRGLFHSFRMANKKMIKIEYRNAEAMADKNVTIYSKNGDSIASFNYKGGGLSFSDDGKHVVVTSPESPKVEGAIKVIDITSLREVKLPVATPSDFPFAVSFEGNDELILINQETNPWKLIARTISISKGDVLKTAEISNSSDVTMKALNNPITKSPAGIYGAILLVNHKKQGFAGKRGNPNGILIFDKDLNYTSVFIEWSIGDIAFITDDLLIVTSWCIHVKGKKPKREKKLSVYSLSKKMFISESEWIATKLVNIANDGNFAYCYFNSPSRENAVVVYKIKLEDGSIENFHGSKILLAKAGEKKIFKNATTKKVTFE